MLYDIFCIENIYYDFINKHSIELCMQLKEKKPQNILTQNIAR